MAETDREDVIPAVLNDLMDVDGAPADGDGLIRSDGAWVPSPPYTLLNGPAYMQYTADYTTSLSTAATMTLINRAEPTRYIDDTEPGNAIYGSQHNFGHWDMPNGTFVFDEPGIYRCVWRFTITLSGVPTNLCWVKTSITVGIETYQDLINDYWPVLTGSSGANGSGITEYRQVKAEIPPGLLADQTYPIAVYSPGIRVLKNGGAETVTAWNNMWAFEKCTPVSTWAVA